MHENRLAKAVRNISWRAIVLFLTAIANLIIPRYIILTYGSEVNGLTASITQVLSIVNLIQAGLGSSVTYLMYKSIEEKNRLRLANIIMSAKRTYRYISIGVFAIGIGASFVFAYGVKTDLQRDFVLIASLITCINSAASTYFTAVANVFLGAKQDGHLISKIQIISNAIGYLLNAVIIVLKLHFIFLYVINMITCLINIIALSKTFQKRYEPYALTENEEKKKEFISIPGVTYAAINEVAHSLVGGGLTISISMFAGLKASSVFAVYMIPISVLSTISNAIYSAIVPSYGSVVAEDNIQKTNLIFEIYQYILFTLNAVMYSCAAYLILPFVSLYVKGATDTNYYNLPLMILIILYGILSVARVPYNNTVYVFGKFKETYLQPLICAIIAIVLMVTMAKMNYSYTVLGAIFFFGANTIYQHFKLKKLIRGFENRHFWRHFAVVSISVALAILLYLIFPLSPKSLFAWCAYACLVGMISILGVFMLSAIIDRKSMMTTIKYFKARLKNKS